MENHHITEEERDAAFWGRFHLDDHKLMYPWLIGNHPHHPKGQPFDYEDVLKVACTEFTNGHFTAFTIDDNWEPSFPEESTKPDPIFQQWFGHEAQDPRASDGDRRGRDHSRYPTFMDSRCRDDTPRREAYHTTGSSGKAVHFQESSWEQENQEIDDIMHQLCTLSPNEQAYVSLYSRCLHRYPAIVQTLQKLDYGHHSTFSVNTPPSPAPPSFVPPSSAPQQPWTEHSAPPSMPSDDKATFFQRNSPEGCAFCMDTGHRICRCPIAEEYIDTGRATIYNKRIHLPNGWPVLNDGSNCGLRHGIDAWLARQSSSSTASSGIRDSPPHTTFSIQTCGYHPPIATVHIVEIVDSESTASDSRSDDEEDGLDIFRVFTAERKKRQTKAVKIPELTPAKKSKSPTALPAPASASPPTSLRLPYP